LLARVLHAFGLINAPANMPALVYDTGGVALILALAWKELPFLAVVAIALRAGIASELEDAARTLGASRRTVARTVTWPLLWRGLFPAVIATFVFAFGSFESAVLLAPIDPAALPVLTMERFADPLLARRGEAYGLALIALGVATIAVAAHEVTRARWGSLVK
jgi:ABC-type spermidine/putrescine transport system permease subunit I